MIYLTLRSDHIEARYDGPPKETAKVRRFDELIAFCGKHNDGIVMSSSSLDFPKEYTKDKKLIALCDRIRNS